MGRVLEMGFHNPWSCPIVKPFWREVEFYPILKISSHISFMDLCRQALSNLSDFEGEQFAWVCGLDGMVFCFGAVIRELIEANACVGHCCLLKNSHGQHLPPQLSGCVKLWWFFKCSQ